MLNAEGVVPGSKHNGDHAGHLSVHRRTRTSARATRAAQRYAATFDKRDDRVVGVTGTVPARYEQTLLVNGALPVLEVVSVVAVVLIVGLAFRRWSRRC